MEINEQDYAQLVQWMEQQQRHIAALEKENHDLRRQLDDLRRGAGMAIVVQGRVIPVNPAPVEVPLPNAGPVPHPSFGPAFHGTGPMPPQHMPQQQQPAQQPSQQPQPAAPRLAIPHLQPAPRPEVFSEELWITGQMRAVKAPAPAQRPISPSQEMTPSWLREDSPRIPQTPTSTPKARRTLATATNSHPAIPKSPSNLPRSVRPDPQQQTGRQRVPARPLSRPSGPLRDSAPLPSLAELTGQRPAVRVPGRQRQDSGERNPYSDSFVLD